MGNISVYTRINTAGIASLKRSNLIALQATTEAVLSDINTASVIPHFTGNLQKSNKIKREGRAFYIIWDSKIGNPSGSGYALAVYENKRGARFKKGRRDHWAEAWITGSKRARTLKFFERAFKNE